MASEKIGLVLSNRLDNHHSQLLFHDESNLGFRCNPPPTYRSNCHTSGLTIDDDSNKTTRELAGFIDNQHQHYQPQGTTELRRSTCIADIQDWGGRNERSSDSFRGDGSDGDGDDDEDDDDDMADVDRLVNCNDNVRNNNSNNTSRLSSDEKHENGIGKTIGLSSFGSSRDVMKEGSVMPTGNETDDVRVSLIVNNQQGQVGQFQNAVTIADPDSELYYSQYLHGAEGSGAGLKDMVVENGCGFSGRKDISYSGDSGESLRAILSDPVTGALMDDAMILACGHSFGSGGIQHVMRTKTCYICSHPVSEGSVATNLSLRSAVEAFRREDQRPSKKRREPFEQEKLEQQRCRGVQYPFSVSDRVFIKGNKRTPPRFVGREAVVTTQCLNGWYVVKTVDNAESVKLQYRSLARVPADKPNWVF